MDIEMQQSQLFNYWRRAWQRTFMLELNVKKWRGRVDSHGFVDKRIITKIGRLIIEATDT